MFKKIISSIKDFVRSFLPGKTHQPQPAIQIVTPGRYESRPTLPRKVDDERLMAIIRNSHRC